MNAPPRKSQTPRLAAVALGALLLAALGWLVLRPGVPSSAPAVESSKVEQTAPEPASQEQPLEQSKSKPPSTADFKRLEGRWLRPHDGYVIEIRQAESGGRLDARYFNPAPIHVAKAEAKTEAGLLHVFIELRDANYPGCVYRLVYDPGNDCLAGTYFQAALQQTYEVVFARMR